MLFVMVRFIWRISTFYCTARQRWLRWIPRWKWRPIKQAKYDEWFPDLRSVLYPFLLHIELRKSHYHKNIFFICLPIPYSHHGLVVELLNRVQEVVTGADPGNFSVGGWVRPSTKTTFHKFCFSRQFKTQKKNKQTSTNKPKRKKNNKRPSGYMAHLSRPICSETMTLTTVSTWFCIRSPCK
jgi:hypothetical protein